MDRNIELALQHLENIKAEPSSSLNSARVSLAIEVLQRIPQRKPEQEPVATVAEVHMSRYTIEWTNGPLPEGTKLYTTPPQRKPLTFDEVEGCFPDGGGTNEYGEAVVSAQWLHDFAAAIQRAAHGIKENT